METAITFVKDHWDDILAVIGGLVTVASVIVKLTPTTKDDTALAWVLKVLDQFSVVNPKIAEKGDVK